MTGKVKVDQTFIKIFNSKTSSIFKIITLFVLFTTFSFGAESADGILKILNKGIQNWIPNVKTACLWVFWVLVAIDITWTFGKMALSGFEIGEFLATLIKKIITIGIFLFLFNIDGWLIHIIDGFSQLSTNVSGGISIRANNIIEQAFKILIKIWDATGWNLAKTLFLLICGLLILIGFLLMAVDLIMAYIKFYIMQIVIFFALALGGLSRYKDIGLNPIIAAIKIGIEIFLIQSLMALCITTIDSSFSELNRKVTIDLVLQILVISVIFCVITKMIPGIIEAVFSGAVGDSAGGAAGFKAVATMAGAAAATAAVGIATGSVGATRAMKAASEAHFQNTPYQTPKNTLDAIKQTGKHTMGIASTLASATKESLKGSFSNLSDKTTSSGRMNDIANRIRERMSPIDETKNVSSGTISGANETYHSGINS
ncbi:TPA: P-type conjugative transfer protein TrbL [Campylobacter fetus subsp. venerealis]|nr:P-type conjugative transfer protein TrbL [Campylobacter fetus subsp. venerealis]HDX6321163.1 P-type conjugative transfer protein TrbL [Campylobacter fetus subsp. venerealis]HDX6323118.1 P-type conjugative transfer protein TrbL [Campylobacter fetus subsp. venerealis]HDX8136013.1 P-type conjugative transfer protein TrbL [Campylobacter fetus subsp. venerealis]